MATAANPFDIKTGAGTTPASGTQGGTLTPATETTAAQFDPVQRQVDAAKETTAGQLQGIMAEDNPLMQQARAQAKQGMAARGLLNSSMAQGAGVAAMLERATPIAAADASTYFNQAQTNQAAANTGGQFNASSQNQFGLQKGAQTFTATQAGLEREQQTSLQTAQQTFSGAQAALDRAQQTALSDKSIEAQQNLQKAQQTFAGAQADLDRAQQTSLQTGQQTFAANQAALDREQQLATIDAQKVSALEQIGFKAKVDLQNIPTAFAANITNTTMNGVNAIMADGNMTADAKKNAITNLITYANAQVDWANKFYSAAIPPITQPK